MKAKVGSCQSPARALGLELAGKSRLDPVPKLPDTRPWHQFPVLTQTQGALPILSYKPTNPNSVFGHYNGWNEEK